ncbi:SAVED domain-containing protein [Pseudomonas plecoglossicida]|nr:MULTISPECIES: Hachiman antiphage defense system protein HamA [Pseudomonas]KGK23292.1 hypothetical protein GT93_28735 [Pseudomonas plecoglossicida]MBA1214774.1 DUF1837 domain-containing protein [Pseudomonas fulva]MBO2889744.1 DUF1837 domain-containing protein [Pseudomonas asiatica]MCK2120152.1 SAVED domain-containing protein [Pseudomonas sp. PNPG3]MDQ7966666.1 SAVED domain-containing protein [Pseudomonas plecoglossicida]
MDGVIFKQTGQYAVCCVENFSDELKTTIRDNLTRICHGADLASRSSIMFKYAATLKSFWDRYSTKDDKTRIGMLGELLAHVIILKKLDSFDVISPFFNMEEKHIRKGFDLVLYESASNEVWITEVKSGGAGTRTSCAATSALLAKARDDLKGRLAEAETNHWHNAINAAQKSISESKGYKESVLEILGLEGDNAYLNTAVASDNNVVLVSALFNDATRKVEEKTVEHFTNKLIANPIFKTVLVLSLQKGTLQKLEDFLRTEAGC